MKTNILGLLAETSIHPGTGRGLGVVDLPVARETATGYPVLVGSSLKGALRDKARSAQLDNNDVTDYFGQPDAAGKLLVSDGRLLLLPIRSLTCAYRWATCPHLIERYRRDRTRAGLSGCLGHPQVARGTVLAQGHGDLFLEERQFSITEPPTCNLVKAIESLIGHPETRERLADQIAVLHDDDFAWFVRYGLAIQARNVLADGTKKSQNLWYEETLPPDTLMYTLIAGRGEKSLCALDKLFPKDNPYLQVGGNETVGQGWFAVERVQPDGGEQ